jgi:hypothetical protein
MIKFHNIASLVVAATLCCNVAQAKEPPYSTVQVLSPACARATVLNLTPGHHTFRVVGDGAHTCVMVATKVINLPPVNSDLAPDQDLKWVVLAGEFTKMMTCTLDLSVSTNTVVMLLVENDDLEAEHAYHILQVR